jgi:hypothetical protein
MGFIDDKNNLIQQISVFEVLGNLPKNRITSSFDSVKSGSRNLLPFMLDLLTITCKDDTKKRRVPPSFDGTTVSPSNPIPVESPRNRGKCELNRIITSILIQFFPELIRIIKEGIIKAFKASLLCPSDFIITNNLTILEAKVNTLDHSGLLKIDVDRLPGKILFGDVNKDLNHFIRMVINNPSVKHNWKNITYFTYNDINETLKVEINEGYIGSTYDKFLKDYIDSTELISIKNLIPTVINELYGTVDSTINNIDLDSILNKEKINKTIDKILDSDVCSDEFNLNDSFFVFNNDELLDIEILANNKKSGTNVIDYGCSPYLSGVDITTLTELYNEISTTPQSGVEEVVNNYLLTLSDEATNGVSGSNDITQQKKAFNLKLAITLPKVFTNVVLTPKIVILNQLSRKIVLNNVLTMTNSFDYVKFNKIFFEFVVRESMAALLQIIYRQIRTEILLLIGNLIKKLIKEQVDKRLKQILSLTGGYTTNSGITSVTDTVNKTI